MKTFFILSLLSIFYSKMALCQSTCEDDVKLEDLIKQLTKSGQQTAKNIMHNIESTLLTKVSQEFCPGTLTKYAMFIRSLDKTDSKEMAVLTGCTEIAGLPFNKAFDITYCQRMTRLGELVNKAKPDKQKTLVDILNDWSEFIVRSFPELPAQIKKAFTSQLKNEKKNIVDSIISLATSK